MSIIITYKLKADCYLYKTFTLVCVSFRCTNYTGVELIEELNYANAKTVFNNKTIRSYECACAWYQ